MLIATNHKPELEVDAAARRRVHLVPFDAELLGQKEDKGLRRCAQERSAGNHGSVSTSVPEWQGIGLAPPKRVSDATAQLFNDLDPIGRFAN